MIGKISGQYGMNALGGKKARKSAYADGFSGASDETNFSSFGVALARYSAELKNVDDVRNDVVDKFKAQVDAGTYVPQLDKVAHTLVIAGLLNAE